MKTPQQRQKEITDKIQAAQNMLSEAAQLACDLGGWCEQWEDIGRGPRCRSITLVENPSSADSRRACGFLSKSNA